MILPAASPCGLFPCAGPGTIPFESPYMPASAVVCKLGPDSGYVPVTGIVVQEHGGANYVPVTCLVQGQHVWAIHITNAANRSGVANAVTHDTDVSS